MSLELDADSLLDGLLLSAKDELRATWGDLRQREVEELEDAAKDLAQLLARRLRPGRMEHDQRADDAEIAHAMARIANWTWVGADKVRARWAAWLEQAAEVAGKVLRAAAKGLVA